MIERHSASKCVPKFLTSYRHGPTSAMRRAMVGSAFLRWATALRIVVGSGMVWKTRGELMTRIFRAAAAIGLAACSHNPPPSATTNCAGNRVLIVTNGGDEAVNVFAVNGRTSTEIGTVPLGKKELVIP